MRRAGTLPAREQAQSFADYLLSLGIVSQVDPGEAGFEVWVHDEDQLPQAIEELEQFRLDPSDRRYRQGRERAQAVREEQARIEKQRRKQTVDVRATWQRSVLQRAPVTSFLILASIVVAVLTRLGKNEESANWFRIAEVVREGGRVWSMPGLVEVRSGEVWRLFTPMLLHFSVLHIFFNMYWLFYLGGMIEILRGTKRLLPLVLCIALVSNLAQFWIEDNPNFGGMSGVVYGLVGYIWVKQRYQPRLGLGLPPTTLMILLIFFLLSMAGAFGGSIANTAHAAGLITGGAVGYLPVLLRR